MPLLRTGWSASWWADLLAKGETLAQGYGFTTARTQSEGMLALVKRKRGWPSAGGQSQFCTAELKVLPALEWLDANDSGKEATAMTGCGAARANIAQRNRSTLTNQSGMAVEIFGSPWCGTHMRCVTHYGIGPDLMLCLTGRLSATRASTQISTTSVCFPRTG